MSSPSCDSPQRYDRQIRLWGEAGQAALSRAAVLLLNANAVGTEALKNLVLPGIASFTVVDGAQVCAEDLGVNFFVSGEARSRAAVVTEKLHELNPAVHASYIAQHVGSFVKNETDAYAFVKRYNVVIAAQMSFLDPTLKYIADACYNANVPLILARAYGMIGYVRIQARELCILDAKEEGVPPDLRLHAPFAQFEEYVASWDLESISDSTEAAHVPFVVILAKAVQTFRQKYGRLPTSREEKEEFRDMVLKLRPKCCPSDAENFEEAVKRSNLRLCYAEAGGVSSAVEMVLRDEKSDAGNESGFKIAVKEAEDVRFPDLVRLKRGGENEGGAQAIAEQNASFWLHAAAVRAFRDLWGCLPVRGSVPDMAADTESYVRLQRIFQTKAEEDAREVVRLGAQIAERYGMDVEFDESSVKRFCKSLPGIRVYRTRSLTEELTVKGEYAAAAIAEGAMDASERGVACYYALLKAVDRFEREHGRRPGGLGESDVALVNEYWGREGGGGRDEAKEICRYGGVELHAVAAFVGGVCAQEVTKVFGAVFEPVKSAVVFDLAQGKSFCFAA